MNNMHKKIDTISTMIINIFKCNIIFVEYKWFERSELTHPRKPPNRAPSASHCGGQRGRGGLKRCSELPAAGRGGGAPRGRGLGTSSNSTLLWKLQLPFSRLAPRPHPSASASLTSPKLRRHYCRLGVPNPATHV